MEPAFASELVDNKARYCMSVLTELTDGGEFCMYKVLWLTGGVIAKVCLGTFCHLKLNTDTFCFNLFPLV